MALPIRSVYAAREIAEKKLTSSEGELLYSCFHSAW